MESELNLIKECGFNSFEEVVKRINELVDVMRVGRERAEKHLQRFTNEAKKLLQEGQKDKAKKVLLKKKNHAERVKNIDNQLDIILGKLREVKNSKQMLQVIKAIKYCNNLLLSELGQKDLVQDNNTDSNENQDLLDNDKEITKYLEILSNSVSKPKKVKPTAPPLAQKLESFGDNMNFPQPENTDNAFPQPNNTNNINDNNTNNVNPNPNPNPTLNKIINNNYNNNNNMNNNFNNFNNNNNYINNMNNYNQKKKNFSSNNNYNNNMNNYNNNNFNNNFNNNNNYNFNNNKKIDNPYDNIF